LSQQQVDTFSVINDRVFLPVLGLLVWCFISLFWIEDGYLAAIMLSQLISYGLILFLVFNIFEASDLDLISQLISISLILVSLIGLIQYYNPDNNFVQNLFPQTAKPGATFANKNMASHFVVMTLPLALVGLLASKNIRMRIFYTISVSVGGWFLIYTIARQAYLAVIVELLFFFLFVLFDYLKNREQSLLFKTDYLKINLNHLIGVIFFLVFASNWTIGGFGEQSHQKFERLESITMDGGAPRFPGWLNTIEMIKDHPIRGVGIGQWPESYPQYYDKVSKDVIFNEKFKMKRLHNDYLEILANIGLFGYFFLLWLVLLVIRRIFLQLLDVESMHRWKILGLSLGLVGFCVVAMFSFPTRVYLPAFFVFFYVGLLFVDRDKKNVFAFKVSRWNRNVIYFAGGLILLLSAAGAKVGYHWLVGESYMTVAKAFAISGQSNLAIGGGLEALKHNRWSPEYYYLTGASMVNADMSEDAIPFLKKTIDISPYNSTALLMLSQAYADIGNADMERKVLLFVLSFDPRNVRAAAFLVKNYSLQRSFSKATEMYMKMKDNYQYFLTRTNFGPYHDLVGQVSVSVGDYHFAKYVFDQAVTENPSAENDIKLATVEFYHLKNYERGVALFSRALDKKPNIEKHAEISKLIQQYKLKTE